MEVYRICNKVNNKSYIGITKWNFKERYPQGKWWLWTHSHHLKRAVERYGLKNFEVQILKSDIVDTEHLVNLEESYIKSYNSLVPNGYNLIPKGSRSNPTNIKEYELIDKFGNLYKISNLSKFCRERKINYGAMLNMVSGRSISSQCFALSSTPIEKILKWKQKVFKIPKKLKKKYSNIEIYDSNNNLIIIDSVYEFCKERNLDRKGIYNLIKGKSLLYKGFRVISSLEELHNEQSMRLGKQISLLSPYNEIIEIKNVSDFCRKNNLNRNNFQCMLKKRIKSYKGWKLNE